MSVFGEILEVATDAGTPRNTNQVVLEKAPAFVLHRYVRLRTPKAQRARWGLVNRSARDTTSRASQLHQRQGRDP
jgi:hypothetical protein